MAYPLAVTCAYLENGSQTNAGRTVSSMAHVLLEANKDESCLIGKANKDGSSLKNASVMSRAGSFAHVPQQIQGHASTLQSGCQDKLRKSRSNRKVILKLECVFLLLQERVYAHLARHAIRGPRQLAIRTYRINPIV